MVLDCVHTRYYSLLCVNVENAWIEVLRRVGIMHDPVLFYSMNWLQ